MTHHLLKLSFQKMKLSLIALLFFTIISGACFAQSLPQTELPRAILTIQGHQLDAQLAQTPYEWSKGLMWRTSMPENEAMLFVFNTPSKQCFWMKNTYLPLSAAFIADDGHIVNIADMRPLSTQEHCSKEPVRFVLEVHQGWFKDKDIQSGAIVSDLQNFIH